MIDRCIFFFPTTNFTTAKEVSTHLYNIVKMLVNPFMKYFPQGDKAISRFFF